MARGCLAGERERLETGATVLLKCPAAMEVLFWRVRGARPWLGGSCKWRDGG